MGGWRKSRFEDIMKKYYLFYYHVIKYVLAIGKLVLFFFVTVFLLPLYFLGKLIKLVFVFCLAKNPHIHAAGINPNKYPNS